MAISDGQPVFRFAPSPNGPLHLGHAYSALLNRDMANRMNGRLLVRMEDIDLARCKPEFERAILDDLEWLGINYDGKVARQSERFGLYTEALDRLRRMGLVYPAFLSRGDVRRRVAAFEKTGRTWPRDPDGAPLYPEDDRALDVAAATERIERGEAHSWRLNMKEAAKFVGPLTWTETNSNLSNRRTVKANPERWGDVVLARSDVPTSYHLAVVVDDAAQGVTHVVRGYDLYDATAVHRVLQALLGVPPPVYHHHGLILGDDGKKLSKSNGGVPFNARRGRDTPPSLTSISQVVINSDRLSTRS